VEAFQSEGQPVISVDTKKKELVGAYKNGGREWRPKGQPEEVKVYDFIDQELGKAIPYRPAHRNPHDPARVAHQDHATPNEPPDTTPAKPSKQTQRSRAERSKQLKTQA